MPWKNHQTSHYEKNWNLKNTDIEIWKKKLYLPVPQIYQLHNQPSSSLFYGTVLASWWKCGEPHDLLLHCKSNSTSTSMLCNTCNMNGKDKVIVTSNPQCFGRYILRCLKIKLYVAISIHVNFLSLSEKHVIMTPCYSCEW